MLFRPQSLCTSFRNKVMVFLPSRFEQTLMDLLKQNCLLLRKMRKYRRAAALEALFEGTRDKRTGVDTRLLRFVPQLRFQFRLQIYRQCHRRMRSFGFLMSVYAHTPII